VSVKTAGVGHFQIPTAPAAGTSCTSGAANTYTTNAVQLIASTVAALYITGLYAEEAAVSAATYKSVQLMIGAGGAETNLGQYLIGPSTGSTVTRTYRPIFPPIPVAASARISVKTADSAGSLATLISLECIAQSNVVDDGIAITTVTTVTNQLTAAQVATGVWQDTTAGDFTTALSIGKSVMNGVALGTGLTINAYTGNTVQTGDSFAIVKSGGTGDNAAIKTKTDFLPSATAGAAGGVFIAGTNAATTITTGLTTTFTGNLTGSVGSVTGAVGSVTGAVGSVTGAVGSVTGAVGSVTGNVGGNVVGSVASVTAAVSITGDLSATMKTSVTTAATAATPTAAAVTGNVGGNVVGSVASVTGNVGGNVVGSVASVTATVNADVKKINGTTIQGTGTSSDLFRG
jgi:hypothetical protein